MNDKFIKCNPKEQAFVLNYIRNHNNATEAMKIVDPDLKNPAQAATRMLSVPRVQAAIEERLERKQPRYDASFDKMVAMVFELIEKAQTNPKMQTIGGYRFILEAIKTVNEMSGHNKRTLAPDQANILVNFVPFAQAEIQKTPVDPLTIPFDFNFLPKPPDSPTDSPQEDNLPFWTLGIIGKVRDHMGLLLCWMI